MATADQIASADTAGRTTGTGYGFIGQGFETATQHQLGGASDSLPDWQTALAARLMAREAPDLAEMLGLTLPDRTEPDLASALVGDVSCGLYARARGWIGDCDRDELAGLRKALAERRAQREGR